MYFCITGPLSIAYSCFTKAYKSVGRICGEHCKVHIHVGTSCTPQKEVGSFANFCTVGTQLSEFRLSEFLIIQTLGRCHVLAVAGKRRSGHWSSATGESKAAV